MCGRYGTIVASTSSPDSSFSLRSSFTQSAHLFFGLPLLLLPCTSIPITLFPTHSSSLLITCPYHRILRSWTFRRRRFGGHTASTEIKHVQRCRCRLRSRDLPRNYRFPTDQWWRILGPSTGRALARRPGPQ